MFKFVLFTRKFMDIAVYCHSHITNLVANISENTQVIAPNIFVCANQNICKLQSYDHVTGKHEGLNFKHPMSNDSSVPSECHNSVASTLQSCEIDTVW